MQNIILYVALLEVCILLVKNWKNFYRDLTILRVIAGVHSHDSLALIHSRCCLSMYQICDKGTLLRSALHTDRRWPQRGRCTSDSFWKSVIRNSRLFWAFIVTGHLTHYSEFPLCSQTSSVLNATLDITAKLVHVACVLALESISEVLPSSLNASSHKRWKWRFVFLFYWELQIIYQQMYQYIYSDIAVQIYYFLFVILFAGGL